LADARSTGVREDKSADVFKNANLAVPINGSSNLFGSRSDRELALDLKSMGGCFLRNRSGAGHVFVGGVGAGTDEGDFEFRRPVVLLDLRCKLGDGCSKIGCKRTVNMGFEFRQVLLARRR
jgi:hypothetical protein